MAIQTLEVVRPRGKAVHVGDTTVFAAEPLNLRNRSGQEKLAAILLASRVSGVDAWKWYNQIGEVHYALTRASRIAGYTKIFPVRYGKDGTIDKALESGVATDTINGVYSRFGGLRQLIERYFLQMKVPGESHLIRWVHEGTADGYMFASTKELSGSDGSTTGLAVGDVAKVGKLKMRTMPGVNMPGVQSSALERPISQKDYLGRVWIPSPEWLDVPESPLGALDVQCDMLDAMTRSMSATLKSRFAMAGILYFSDKVRDAIGNRHSTKSGKTILDVLYAVMKENFTVEGDTGDISAILPIMMQGSAEIGKVAEHIIMDREILAGDLALRSELIDRILFGLDINVGSTKGGEDTSHWGQWNNNADELRLAVIPDVEGFCWTIDRMILRPALIEAGVKDPETYGVWYQLDEASVRANRQADAREAFDRGWLKGESMLRAAGFTDDDLPDVAEYLRWLGVKLRIPRLATYGHPEYNTIDWTDPTLQPGASGRIPDNTGEEDPKVGPGEGDPGSPDDDDSDTPKEDKPI